MSAKKCLFGGALFAAGLVSQAAAQDFQFELNYGGLFPTSSGYAGAYEGANGGYSYFTSYDPNNALFNLNYAYGASNASAVMTMSSMSASATASALGGYAQGQSYGYVSFDAGELLRIVWDFGNEEPGFSPFFSDIAVVNWTNGGVVEFAVDPSADPNTPNSGDVIFAPTPGHLYAIFVECIALSGGSTSASVSVVPAPGALALAGLGGLVAIRRRR